MKQSRRRIFILFPIIILLIAAGYFLVPQFSQGTTEVVDLSAAETYQSGPFRVTITLSPDAPVVGKNQLALQIADRDGNPVEAATLKVYGEMPAMGAMAAMRAPADLKEIEPGIYAGEMDLPMRGEWPMSVHISKEGIGETRMGFDMATGRAGLSISSGGSLQSPVAGMTDQPMSSQDPDHNHDHGISHYSCPMHPSVQSADPGSCPICGMDLVPVSKVEVDTGIITVDNQRRQLIGVKTAAVSHQNLTKVIRAVGQVDYDETRISNVSLKFNAWIGKLMADYVGAQIERGQVLFTVYSPELLASQQEYLETLQRLSRRGPDDSLLKAARKRLMLWDISAAQISQLEKNGTPMEYLPIFAPRGGTVVEKAVVEGSYVNAGSTLLRIADLSQVWVDAEVYEADLPLITEGMNATITLPYLPETQYSATVDYVYPYLEEQNRTARIRLVLENGDGRLKPDMYAEVSLEVDLGDRLVVPEEAVLIAGKSRVVFVDMGEGKLKPVRIKTGNRVEGYIEVTEGLELGDIIVTSGNFLIAAEAKLKTGVSQW